MEAFNKQHAYRMSHSANDMFHILDCRALIDTCTETPFPDFHVEDNDHDRIEVLQEDRPNEPNTIKIGGNKVFLNNERFKKFVDGCNKAMKWIEENEEAN